MICYMFLSIVRIYYVSSYCFYSVYNNFFLMITKICLKKG